jgi:UDP-glucuronate decarboxylase
MLLIHQDAEVSGPVNLGNPNEFTMLELAHLVLQKTNSTSEIIFEELPSDDPRQRKPDISLAQSLLGWNPKIQLDEGLKRTISYFERNIAL